jgi:hypothetical protein
MLGQLSRAQLARTPRQTPIQITAWRQLSQARLKCIARRLRWANARARVAQRGLAIHVREHSTRPRTQARGKAPASSQVINEKSDDVPHGRLAGTQLSSSTRDGEIDVDSQTNGKETRDSLKISPLISDLTDHAAKELHEPVAVGSSVDSQNLPEDQQLDRGQSRPEPSRNHDGTPKSPPSQKGPDSVGTSRPRSAATSPLASVLDILHGERSRKEQLGPGESNGRDQEATGGSSLNVPPKNLRHDTDHTSTPRRTDLVGGRFSDAVTREIARHIEAVTSAQVEGTPEVRESTGSSGDIFGWNSSEDGGASSAEANAFDFAPGLSLKNEDRYGPYIPMSSKKESSRTNSAAGMRGKRSNSGSTRRSSSATTEPLQLSPDLQSMASAQQENGAIINVAESNPADVTTQSQAVERDEILTMQVLEDFPRSDLNAAVAQERDTSIGKTNFHPFRIDTPDIAAQGQAGAASVVYIEQQRRTEADGNWLSSSGPAEEAEEAGSDWVDFDSEDLSLVDPYSDPDEAEDIKQWTGKTAGSLSWEEENLAHLARINEERLNNYGPSWLNFFEGLRGLVDSKAPQATIFKHFVDARDTLLSMRYEQLTDDHTSLINDSLEETMRQDLLPYSGDNAGFGSTLRLAGLLSHAQLMRLESWSKCLFKPILTLLHGDGASLYNDPLLERDALKTPAVDPIPEVKRLCYQSMQLNMVLTLWSNCLKYIGSAVTEPRTTTNSAERSGPARRVSFPEMIQTAGLAQKEGTVNVDLGIASLATAVLLTRSQLTKDVREATDETIDPWTVGKVQQIHQKFPQAMRSMSSGILIPPRTAVRLRLAAGDHSDEEATNIYEAINDWYEDSESTRDRLLRSRHYRMQHLHQRLSALIADISDCALRDLAAWHQSFREVMGGRIYEYMRVGALSDVLFRSLAKRRMFEQAHNLLISKHFIVRERMALQAYAVLLRKCAQNDDLYHFEQYWSKAMMLAPTSTSWRKSGPSARNSRSRYWLMYGLWHTRICLHARLQSRAVLEEALHMSARTRPGSRGQLGLQLYRRILRHVLYRAMDFRSDHLFQHFRKPIGWTLAPNLFRGAGKDVLLLGVLHAASTQQLPTMKKWLAKLRERMDDQEIKSHQLDRFFYINGLDHNRIHTLDLRWFMLHTATAIGFYDQSLKSHALGVLPEVFKGRYETPRSVSRKKGELPFLNLSSREIYTSMSKVMVPLADACQTLASIILQTSLINHWHKVWVLLAIHGYLRSIGDTAIHHRCLIPDKFIAVASELQQHITELFPLLRPKAQLRVLSPLLNVPERPEVAPFGHNLPAQSIPILEHVLWDTYIATRPEERQLPLIWELYIDERTYERRLPLTYPGFQRVRKYIFVPLDATDTDRSPTQNRKMMEALTHKHMADKALISRWSPHPG